LKEVNEMGRIGTTELLLNLGVAHLIFGPSKLPQLGKMLGKAVGSTKRFINSYDTDWEDEEEESGKKKKKSAVKAAADGQAATQAASSDEPDAEVVQAEHVSADPVMPAVSQAD
jgi:TatA/E family protein of Tat protein translocase